MKRSVPNIGRHVFGLAAFAFGIIALVWHVYSDRNLLHVVWNGMGGPVFAYAAAAAFIAGGIALQFRRFARIGAVATGATFLVFMLLCVPKIVATPFVYDPWGNFFEQFSLTLGAVFAYASVAPAPRRLFQIGGVLLGVCSASFAIVQAVHLAPTESLVPKWIPPNREFWAIATTVAFALAAVALVTNRLPILASKLLTAMVAGFGVVVWLPIIAADPHDRGNWGETVETFAIAGTAWIFAGLLAKQRSRKR